MPSTSNNLTVGEWNLSYWAERFNIYRANNNSGETQIWRPCLQAELSVIGMCTSGESAPALLYSRV